MTLEAGNCPNPQPPESEPNILKVTSIKKSTKKKGEYLIYVDGRFSFSVPEEEYFKMSLYEKKVLTEDEISHIKTEVLEKNARIKALRYITYKLRTEQETRNKLAAEKFPIDVIDSTINYLKSLGYINDELYVQKYLHDRKKLKPVSQKMLKYQLLKKGVNENIIDDALENYIVDEVFVAESLLKRKFGKYNLKEEKNKKKAYAFLSHRGFSLSIIKEAIKGVNNKKTK